MDSHSHALRCVDASSRRRPTARRQTRRSRSCLFAEKKSAVPCNGTIPPPLPPSGVGKRLPGSGTCHRERGWCVPGSSHVSPWERGRRASTVKVEALECLGERLWQFAESLEALVRRNGSRRDFREDAQCLVRRASCRAWIVHVCDAHTDLTEADAEAALTSAYMEVMTISCRGLFAAYEGWIASRLQRFLHLAMKMIRLELSSAKRREQVLEPMARFFLESLRTLESNPNRLAVDLGRRLAVRPFGWSPGHDDLDVFLSLLIVRQVKGRYWPKAFKYSPFAYYLRSETLAAIENVERLICESCGKEFFQRSLSECPECGGRICRTEAKYLLSESHAEAHFARIPSSREEGPRLRAEREDLQRRAFNIAMGRALEIWKGTVGRTRKNCCRIAILCSLADLDDVPGPTQLGCPRHEWLRRIVNRFFDGSLQWETIAQHARMLLPRVAMALGVTPCATLSDENSRTIISRVRTSLLG